MRRGAKGRYIRQRPEKRDTQRSGIRSSASQSFCGGRFGRHRVRSRQGFFGERELHVMAEQMQASALEPVQRFLREKKYKDGAIRYII